MTDRAEAMREAAAAKLHELIADEPLCVVVEHDDKQGCSCCQAIADDWAAAIRALPLLPRPSVEEVAEVLWHEYWHESRTCPYENCTWAAESAQEREKFIALARRALEVCK